MVELQVEGQQATARVPPKRRPEDRGCGGGLIADLHASAGNRAVAQLMAGDEAETAEVLSGSIGEISAEGGPTVECDQLDAFDERLRIRALVRFDSTRSSSTGGAARSSADSVTSAVVFSSAVTAGGAAPNGTQFGLMQPVFTTPTTTWTRAGTVVSVATTLTVNGGWGAHAIGRTDVASAASAVVAQPTWTLVRDDLKPDGSGRAARGTYWCQDLTSQHERFHANDCIGRARLFVPTGRAFLDGQTVDGTSSATIQSGVTAAVQTMLNNAIVDWNTYYAAGGEDRAYGDGKASYQARSDAVAARAVTEHW